LLAVGAAGDALGATAHGLAASQSGLDHLYDAELHRVAGLAHSALGQRGEAVLALERSLAVAKEREHVLFELKTAADFAELFAEDGNRGRAKELLEAPLGRIRGDAPLVERARRLHAAL
jgi:hypothetical protein